MTDTSDLLLAFAALLWPLLGFTVVFLFRNDFSRLLERLKRGKLFGQELELKESLDKLDEKASAVAKEIPLIETVPPKSGEESTSKFAEQSKKSDVVEKVLEVASSSPKAGLMLLSSEIEKQLREFTARTGHHTRLKHNTPLAVTRYWQKTGWLSQQMGGTLDKFWKVRNQIVHGAEASEDDILRAVDSGLTILKALKSLPQEVNIVYHPGVEVFSDRECKEKQEDARGIILETTSPGGALKSHRIYPTTLTNYQRGKQVAWEWNFSRHWGPCWYRDPDSGEIQQAWGESVEFIGPHLDAVI